MCFPLPVWSVSLVSRVVESVEAPHLHAKWGGDPVPYSRATQSWGHVWPVLVSDGSKYMCPRGVAHKQPHPFCQGQGWLDGQPEKWEPRGSGSTDMTYGKLAPGTGRCPTEAAGV